MPSTRLRGNRYNNRATSQIANQNAPKNNPKPFQKPRLGIIELRYRIEMNNRDDASARCCAECGKEGSVSLKTCKACMSVRYCNASCQRKHWPKHKVPCKERAAKLRDEVLFKDPPPKEECPICFLPSKIICCVSLPPATRLSVPIYDFALANEKVASRAMKEWYACCGKSICNGCVHSLCESGNGGTCPFCKADTLSGTDEEEVEKLMKRVEANDAGTMYALGHYYNQGQLGLQQDLAKGVKLWTQAAKLGSSDAQFQLGRIYDERGDTKKAKFHYEAAAMAGHEVARCHLGSIEGNSGNIERAIKHCTIAASAGHYIAMQNLIEEGTVSRESIDSTLIAYNNSCDEMRSEARDAYMRRFY